MKRLILLCIGLLSAPLAQAQVSFGQPETINVGWRFTPGDPERAQEPDFDTSRWQAVDLPHDWSVRGVLSPTLASCTGFLPGGIGWYRKNLELPAGRNIDKIYLYFEGVYNRSRVYVNGHLLGERPNGYISFLYDATPYIDRDGPNVVAVRVDHSQSADSRWYTGSGIYRNVWMICASAVHIAQWGVFAYPEQADSEQGILSVRTRVENESDATAELMLHQELYDAAGRLVASNRSPLVLHGGTSAEIEKALRVKNPALWSVDTPNLYTLKTTVRKGNEVVDQTETRTGFRTFTFDPDKGFALNGERMKIKGVCLHHDAGVLGSAVPKEVWHRRLLTLKEIGCNAIRTSHNPQSPDLYDLCDELGLLVLDEAFDEWEFPKRKWLEGWNVGTPGFQGNYDFFEEWGERDLADLVRRDRNHLSVFAWSIGNEVDYPNDPYSHPALGGSAAGGFTQATYGGYKPDAPNAERLGDIARRLVVAVKANDRSRPTTAGLAGVAMSNETAYPGLLDIAGYNYTESRYAEDHEKYPTRVIYGSENRHEKSAWDAVTRNEHIFGQFLWTGIDYLGESGRWPSRGFYSGLLDFAGSIKPRGYFRQALWSTKPMAYLGTYPTPGRGTRSQMRDVWSQLDAEAAGDRYEEKTPSMDAWPLWNYTEGQSIRVVCYTNGRQAELLLDGETVGVRKRYDETTGIIFWDIPYRPGTLEVVVMDDSGVEVVRHSIRSSGAPRTLKIEPVEREIDRDRAVAHVLIRVVDERGIPVVLSDNEVTVQIAGPARLLGLEAADNEDMSDYTDNKHRVFQGRMLAYVQSTGEPGEIRIRCTSPWLQTAECTIRVR
jgi:hypothetical protein